MLIILVPPPLPPSLPPPVLRRRTRTSKLAVVSLIMSVPAVLLGPIGFPAVVCGHIALWRIKRSAGALRGKAAGIIGIFLGYLGLAFFALSMSFLHLILKPMLEEAGMDIYGNKSEKTFELSKIALPNFPELPPLQPIGDTGVRIAQVNFARVNRGPRVPPGARMKLQVYMPAGEHPPHSLPCVLVAPSGTTMLEGANLTDLADLGDLGSIKSDDPLFMLDESSAYARAGFVAINYSLDGERNERATDLTQGMKAAYTRFRDAGAGTVNGRNALEFALRRISAVDPDRIFAAGHSSAGTVALLLSANEPRLRGCLAYAPGIDLKQHLEKQSKELGNLDDSGIDLFLPRFSSFLKFASPMEQVSRIKGPVYLFQAQDDSIVPYDTAVRFVETLREANVEVAFESVESGDHSGQLFEKGIPGGIQWIKKEIGIEPAATKPEPER